MLTKVPNNLTCSEAFFSLVAFATGKETNPLSRTSKDFYDQCPTGICKIGKATVDFSPCLAVSSLSSKKAIGATEFDATFGKDAAASAMAKTSAASKDILRRYAIISPT
jgi:hypothetical protein